MVQIAYGPFGATPTLVLATLFITVLFFGLLMGLMALGVIAQGKRLAGSCGGDPDSAHCGCSPKKRAECREHAGVSQHKTPSDGAETFETNVFAGRPLTEETLAPPGERRLIQLRTGRL